VRRSGLAALAVLGVAACGVPDSDPGAEEAMPVAIGPTNPGIQATNAFYYYEDVEAAWAFYTDVLGFQTVADFGFAKIMRVAGASFLTLVDAEQGMHSADEPKTVTLALVTEQVEGWWAYLSAAGVPMRSDFEAQDGRPHDGFVAVDPEGYLLEFERFNPHEENADLIPVLALSEPIVTGIGSRPPELSISATVYWLYYEDLSASEAFYERLLGSGPIVDQGWAKLYQASATGFVGLVDGARGLHRATEEKGVTLSFFTRDVEAWFDRAADQGLELRTPEITDESGRVRVFVAYDGEGYFLEWDTFLDVDGNQELLEALVRE
jgi:uncharacterized glyoxalase superfamily protein PhnB